MIDLKTTVSTGLQTKTTRFWKNGCVSQLLNNKTTLCFFNVFLWEQLCQKVTKRHDHSLLMSRRTRRGSPIDNRPSTDS